MLIMKDLPVEASTFTKVSMDKLAKTDGKWLMYNGRSECLSSLRLKNLIN